MRARTARFSVSIGMITSVLAMLGFATVAAAQAPPSDGEPPAATPYITKVQNGIRLAVARDFDGALASLREAVQLNSAQPEAFYYMGEAQRMAGNLSEALEAFRTSARLASQMGNALFEGRALQGVAETLERTLDKRSEAREAWNGVFRHGEITGNNAMKEIARARSQALDRATEQDEVYVAVRERIAERERVNAQGSASGRRQGGH